MQRNPRCANVIHVAIPRSTRTQYTSSTALDIETIYADHQLDGIPAPCRSTRWTDFRRTKAFVEFCCSQSCTTQKRWLNLDYGFSVEVVVSEVVLLKK